MRHLIDFSVIQIQQNVHSWGVDLQMEPGNGPQLVLYLHPPQSHQREHDASVFFTTLLDVKSR